MIGARAWSAMFWAAAVWNFAIGLPIWFAHDWTYDLVFLPPGSSELALAPHLWGDFGFTVILIGAGYALVARDIHSNRGIVWLGIAGKMFDVISLTYRYVTGIQRWIVLVPAIGDAVFVLMFCIFLYQVRAQITLQGQQA